MKSFKVSNFRLFGEDGVKVEFKPVTVLTGANSSGKSSFVKALVAFGKYLDAIVDDYRRDGSYEPEKKKLSFAYPKLKMKGFSSVLNNELSNEASMSFFIELSPAISSLGGKYEVTYSFSQEETDKALDQGSLNAISISFSGDEFLRLEKSNNRLIIVKFDATYLLEDFVNFCKFCYLPYRIVEDAYDFDGADPDFTDDEGNFACEKASNTSVGKRLARIQRRDNPIFSYAHVIEQFPRNEIKKYKNLFSLDLFSSVEKCVEYNLFYYFPVLERFVGKDKEESIKILQQELVFSDSLSILETQNNAKKNLEKLITAYKESCYDCFIDYYRSLEDYIFGHANKRFSIPNGIRRLGESVNLIEDKILSQFGVSYDTEGFTRYDEEETLFSIAYGVLSNWQWAEEEREKAKVKNEIWGENDDYIKRSIDPPFSQFQSRHKLDLAFKDFVRFVLNDCLICRDLTQLEYNTGSFAAVHRLHSFEENSDFVKTISSYLQGSSLLRSLIQEKSKKTIIFHNDEELYIPDTFLNKWLGQEGLGICKSIHIDLVEGLGFKISLEKENGVFEPLADLGHGVTQIIAILLQIENSLIQNAILDYKNSETEGGSCGIHNGAIIAIEEPEVSLHPCYQSRLADIFQDAVENYGSGLSFIVETHSEYLVRKMQAIVSGFSKEQFEKNPFVVYYFEQGDGAYDLGFLDSGRFERAFGAGFFDESSRSMFILRQNISKKLE